MRNGRECDRYHTDSATEAAIYAEMYAQEHAERILVPMYVTETGGELTTTNGTHVVYSAEFRESD